MKTIFFISAILLLLSCNNSTNTNKTDSTLEKKETTQTVPTNTEAAQITATFKNEQLLLVGKIKQQCNNTNECKSTIIAKQKDKNNEIMYELSIEMNHKIEVGNFTLTNNMFGTFNDIVHKIEKGEGQNKYSKPTTYKQKEGSITITSINNNLANGTFTVQLYNVDNNTLLETITATFKNLPIVN